MGRDRRDKVLPRSSSPLVPLSFSPFRCPTEGNEDAEEYADPHRRPAIPSVINPRSDRLPSHGFLHSTSVFQSQRVSKLRAAYRGLSLIAAANARSFNYAQDGERSPKTNRQSERAHVREEDEEGEGAGARGADGRYSRADTNSNSTRLRSNRA
jgi:hypothetical protein